MPATQIDNKIRLDQDVLIKAQEIAQKWGLKNSRAAIEAVFRTYADEYSEHRPANTEPPTAEHKIPSGERVRCECRRLTDGEAVAVWYKGSGDPV